MKKKHCINYRAIFKKPIVIFSIGKVSLPIGIELRRIFIALIIGVVLALIQFTILNHLLRSVFKITLVLMIYYSFPMIFLSGVLCEEQEVFDGKTAFQFVKGFLIFFFTIKIGKKQFANDKEAIYMQKAVSFQKTRLHIVGKEKEVENEVVNADAGDTREFVAHEKRDMLGVLQYSSDNTRQ